MSERINAVEQAARDYDMDYEEVLPIYRKYYEDTTRYYEELEWFIKIRRNKE